MQLWANQFPGAVRTWEEVWAGGGKHGVWSQESAGYESGAAYLVSLSLVITLP